jgi:hypothetical protein
VAPTTRALSARVTVPVVVVPCFHPSCCRLHAIAGRSPVPAMNGQTNLSYRLGKRIDRRKGGPARLLIDKEGVATAGFNEE